MTSLHDFLLYDFNLCYNLMKKPLLERAMAYNFFFFLDSLRYCKKKKKTQIFRY